MPLEQAYAQICGAIPYDQGAFYGVAHDGLAIGAGLIYSNVLLPLFNEDRGLFASVRAEAVYVVTHECDVDQENDRYFNRSVLVCPIIPFEVFIDECADHPNLPGYLGDIGRRRVPRLLYIPSLGEQLRFGGVLYLNQMTHTNIEQLRVNGVGRIGVVSATGLREVDAALLNLLGRPKADALWGMRP